MVAADVTLVPVGRQSELIVDVLTALGAPVDEARTQADQLVEGDLRGHPSHGARRLPVIAERLRRGNAVTPAETRIEWTSPGAGTLFGGGGLGPVVARRAVALVGARARETGVALIAVRDSDHVGMLAPYVEELAGGGLIGIASTTSEALVRPWGGTQAILGTDPLAVCIPAEPEPFSLDVATGIVSMGKILAYGEAERQLEPGWAVDAEGSPTLDPARAVEGAISPFGGAKGYGLGLALELLVGGLSGTGLGADVHGTLDADSPCTKGDLFIAIDPVALGVHDLAPRIGAFLQLMRASRPDPEHGPVRIPGDGARERRERTLRRGIEHPAGVWSGLEALREELA